MRDRKRRARAHNEQGAAGRFRPKKLVEGIRRAGVCWLGGHRDTLHTLAIGVCQRSAPSLFGYPYERDVVSSSRTTDSVTWLRLARRVSTSLGRKSLVHGAYGPSDQHPQMGRMLRVPTTFVDRKSTRLNSSHT